MVCLSVVLTVRDEGDVAEIARLLTEQGRLSRAEPGCLRFEVNHSKSDTKVFLLNERWESQAALDEHRKAQAFTEIYIPQVLPKVDRVPHECEVLE